MLGFAVFGRAALVALCGASVSSAQAQSCPTAAAEPVTLASVAPRLELKLVDGRLLRIAGLEAAVGTPTTPDLDAGGSATFAALLDRHALAVTVLSQKPDRWGRWTVFASIPDGPVGGLAAAALAAGVARYRPDPAAAGCRTALLAAEETARRARRGLWADPAYRVLAADDRQAFAERAGGNVVVEARVRGVEAGTFRTTLRLESPAATPAGSRERLLEATIAPRVMKIFVAHGMDVQSMIGKTFRLRGLLDRRFGPRIELAGPDEVEILPDSATPTRSN